MYQNIHVQRGKGRATIHIWDDKKGYYSFPHNEYAYIKDSSGLHTSLYGDRLKKVTYWNPSDVEAGKMFESDVPTETRVLVDMYGDSDEVSAGHREVYFDIEVEVKGGFPDPHEARNKITAIALYDKVADEYTCLILGDVNDYEKDNVRVEAFYSEEDLLQRFYQKYLEIQPTILSGWNIDGFDIPYVYYRTMRVLGPQVANSLSPIGNVFYSENKKRFKIAGVSCLDYLSLYRKFTYTEQSSYRLDYIGQVEVGIGKVEYEGTLDDLYKNDIKKFIEYNLVDVKIVKAIDDKFKLIDLAMGIAHVGHVPYEDVYFSSRYLEGALLTYLKKINVVAPNKNLKAKELMNSNEKFVGAYVMEPKPGRYEWVYDLDLTSMYPSIIMSLNISPEMKIGKLNGWDVKEFMKGTTKTYSFDINGKPKGAFTDTELRDLLDNNEVSISTNGVLYKNEKKGLIPSILEKWFDERVEYKKLAKKYAKSGEKQKHTYFNKRQHVQKIMLNSLYGALGLPVFRFFDLDNAAAVTTCGQELIKFTSKIANYYYNKELNDTEDYCIYTDTDSVFYQATPLVKNRFPDADITDNDFMTEQILIVAKEVQDFINESYNYFAKKFLNVKGEHRFDIKQECIARSAFWVTKKRYGQWIINDGGVTCDRLDVKGLDIVRSNFPVAFKTLMTEVLQDILSNVDKDIIDNKILNLKEEMKEMNLSDIALPTGVKNLKKFKDKTINRFSADTMFTDVRKGTPVHVKAAIMYNDLLRKYKLTDVQPIRSSDKIKWVYLKSNPFNIPAIAFKGYDDPDEVLDFIKQYVDHEKLFDRALNKKLKNWYEALSWDEPVNKEETLERFF